MQGTHYWDCRYSMDEEEKVTTFNTTDYPCQHPHNWEGDCPLQNKKPGQKAPCRLLEN